MLTNTGALSGSDGPDYSIYNGGRRESAIRKGAALSGILAILFGMVLSAVFVAVKIYVRRMQTFWIYRYLSGMLAIILGIGLIFTVIVTAVTWRSSRRIERRDENG